MLCASALTLLPCWQGYTGFLPGHGNHFAKTYGNVSKAALAERQANDDPLKWRKFVSYAEFTPPKTPAKFLIPGYSGNVAGVYGENLFAKTYGKTTLQAVSGDYPKGQIYNTEEQVRLASLTSARTPRRGHRSCALWRDDAAPTPHRTLSLARPLARHRGLLRAPRTLPLSATLPALPAVQGCLQGLHGRPCGPSRQAERHHGRRFLVDGRLTLQHP